MLLHCSLLIPAMRLWGAPCRDAGGAEGLLGPLWLLGPWNHWTAGWISAPDCQGPQGWACWACSATVANPQPGG